MRATAGGGSLLIERRIGFTKDGAGVRTEGTARNQGSAALDAETALVTRVELATGPLEGGALWSPGKPPTGRATLTGADLAAGEWRFEKPGLTWKVAFTPGQLDGVRIDWANREMEGVRLELASKRAKLGGGAEHRVEGTR